MYGKFWNEKTETKGDDFGKVSLIPGDSILFYLVPLEVFHVLSLNISYVLRGVIDRLN